MNFQEYQKHAERTAKHESDKHRRLANFSMGLTGEAGEVCDYLKKVIFHGHALEDEKLIKELGDVLWYVAAICNTMGYDMEMVAERNIDKLYARYPEGFTFNKSINREENQ